jgi:hypothetical protein
VGKKRVEEKGEEEWRWRISSEKVKSNYGKPMMSRPHFRCGDLIFDVQYLIPALRKSFILWSTYYVGHVLMNGQVYLKTQVKVQDRRLGVSQKTPFGAWKFRRDFQP